MSIFQELAEYISSESNMEPTDIKPEMRLVEDLGWNDMELFFFVETFEEEHDIELPLFTVESGAGEIVETVGRLASRIEEEIPSKS